MGIFKVIELVSSLPIGDRNTYALTKKAESSGAMRGFKTGIVVGAIGGVVLVTGTYVMARAACVALFNGGYSDDCCDECDEDCNDSNEER